MRQGEKEIRNERGEIDGERERESRVKERTLVFTFPSSPAWSGREGV